MADVLFIKTSSLGDVIHHMPAVTEARARRPADRFSWVVEEAFTPLVRLHPAVDEVIPVATRRWRGRGLLAPSTWLEIARFRQAVQARRYDEVVDTQGLLFKSAATAWGAYGTHMALKESTALVTCGLGAGGACCGAAGCCCCGGATEMPNRRRWPAAFRNSRSKLICNGLVGKKPVRRSILLLSIYGGVEAAAP